MLTASTSYALGYEPAQVYAALIVAEGWGARKARQPAEFYYDLGILYALNGRLDDAEEMYKRAIASEPNNELFFKAIQAARQGKEDQQKLREQQRGKP